MAMPERRAA
jgi:hypothetical protein